MKSLDKKLAALGIQLSSQRRIRKPFAHQNQDTPNKAPRIASAKRISSDVIRWRDIEERR